MRLLALNEKDTALFNSYVNRTLYILYRDNADSFTVMWEQQGTGFWLKFCITLRSVLKKQGFSIQLSAFELNHFETFCIDLVKLLTSKSAEAVHTYVKDVVSVSRFHQLFLNIPDVFIPKDGNPTPAFFRLFGLPSSKGNLIKMFGILPLHLRSVGCLLRLLERWLAAEAGGDTDNSCWHVPEIWHRGNQLLASHFEIFLKRNWDRKLLSLLGVHAKDICWWNELPKEGKVTISRHRHRRLGSFIAALSKKFDVAISDCTGIMINEILYHHIMASCPRGKFGIFSTYSRTVVFEIAFCRGLYMVDCMSAFHPFSQAIISFMNAAFASSFLWHGERGMLSCYHRWAQAESGPYHALVTNYRKEMECLLRIISSHLINARAAMALNSKFHDSLYGGVTWTSPVTLVRLLWNIPLFINWLEVLLIQIYKFERFFIPLCHFPLSKNVISLVECVYRQISEAKFLVKTCLIIADGILKRKMQDASACYKPRKLVSDVIPRLSHVMKFLERDAYRVLDVILRTGWNKEERKGDEHSPLTDRVKVDLASWNSVPNIDRYYSENFRCINYWITSEECSYIDGREECYTKAFEMLRDYKLGQRTLVKMEDPYEFTLFMACAQSKHLNFVNKSDYSAQDLFLFATSVLKLLQEDGWLSSLARKGFFALFGVPYDLSYIEALNSESNDNGVKNFYQMVQFAAVYYVASCLVGDTWQCQIAEQNALAQLQRNETLAIMADTGARLNILTHMSLGNIRCPPAQYFKDAMTEIQERSTDGSLNAEEATLLLESFEKESTKKIRVGTTEALTPVKVPLMEEMPVPSVGINWLKYLESKRIQLLQLVSDEQFIITQSYIESDLPSSVGLFPLYDILEHRFVEEMGSMRKCLELGGLFYGPAYGLCRLLAHRFTWIQQSFLKWRKEKHACEIPEPGFDSMNLYFSIVHIRVRIVAALIPLQALFITYISKYQTTHPISEATISMFYEWTDIERLRSMTDTFLLGSQLRDYDHALKQMGCEYFEQMLDHCQKVWVVSPFCSNPEAAVEFGSITHAQQIVTTFKQLFLMGYFAILAQNPQISALILPEKLLGMLVFVTVVLRKIEIDVCIIPQTWPRVREEVKKYLHDVWSELLAMRDVVGPSVRNVRRVHFPRWRGNNAHIWKEFFVMFVGSGYRNILLKIAFSEFINTKVPEPDDGSDMKVQKEAASKINSSKTDTKRMPRAHVSGKADKTVNGPSKTSNNKTETNASVKSNTADKNVGSSDGIKNKSQETPTPNAKGNKKQRRRPQTNEASKLSAASGSEALSKHRICAHCKTMEAERRTYKKCSLCKKKCWKEPRFYCSRECQERDWKAKHNLEHKSAGMSQ